jgi:hypothetical protein
MYRFAALYLLVSFAFAAPASQDETARVETHGELPAGWVAGAPPSTQEELMCANWAQGWKVEGSGNDGIVLSHAGHSQAQFSIALDDGVMWATNKGEWGGKVEWQPANTDKRVPVMGGNPVAFMPFQGAMFVAAGLAHGFSIKTEHGTDFVGGGGKQVARLVRSDGTWKVDGAMTLDMAPHTVLQSGENAIIVGNRGVIAANLRTMQASQLHRNDDWSLLFPNSIAAIGNDSYLIGLRSGVVKLARNGAKFDEQWWRPAACARMQPVENGRCACLPQQ